MGTRNYGSGSKREKRLGVWELRAHGRSTTFRGTPKEAERALAKLVAAAPSVRSASSSMTLAELVEQWRAAARLAPATVRIYDAALKHLPASVAKMKLDALTLRTFDALYVDLERSGLGAPMIRKLHVALSSALTEGVRWGVVASHPARGARLPAVARKRVQVPQADALARIFAQVTTLEDEAWLRLALSTGSRRSEVLALRWSSVDLDAGAVRVAASLDADRSVRMTKTGGERVVQVDAETVAVLRRWRVAQLERAMACGVRLVRDPFVLSHSPDCSVPWKPMSTTQKFRRIAEAAGVEGVTLHQLRHAHASMLIGAGVDVLTVSHRLGHARASMTLDVYGHLIGDADRRAADVIGAAMQGMSRAT